MPSLSFDSENGKAVAYIKVNKEELKAKPELKSFNNQVIYLHDDNLGVKEIELDDVSVFPIFKFKENEKQNNRVSVFGKSGSGKSFIVGKILDTLTSKKHGKQDRDIVIVSGVDEDEALDKERGPKGKKQLPERIDMYSPEFAEMSPEDFEDCILVFDDIENLTNKAVNRTALALRNSLLEKGRHKNIDVITISHQAMGGNLTKFVHSESTGNFVFPAFSQTHQLNSYLTKYCGLSKTAIEKIVNLGETKSRWIYISNLAPMFVVYEKGIYLVK